jgi:hypothetical protein
MKSHLAYHFMLSHALGRVAGDEQPKNVLLVSLRDDLDAARNTLVRLIKQQKIADCTPNPNHVLDDLLRTDRLEILYNWPGCVTPNEFFHRIFVALARKRGLGNSVGCDKKPQRDTAEIVVLNGLEHLDVKFPLCAAEQVFVPGLISLFRCFKVCSIVVSGEDRPGSSHDIRPLSDLILEFSNAEPADFTTAQTALETMQSSKVSAVRVPAGQIGGRWGVLGRLPTGLMAFYPVGPLKPSAVPR